jgi:AraC family transcriptional regulator
MKQQTVAFHRDAGLRAARLIAARLDQAIDLGGLAAEVGISPQHFHRIFKRELGETPLKLHRRLRLERAALQLALSAEAVTAIAFDAGYETHEAFTHAFQTAYGQAPSEFRRRMQVHRELMGRPDRVPYQLPAPNGLHVESLRSRQTGPGTGRSANRAAPSRIVAGIDTIDTLGESQMSIDIVAAKPLRLAAVSHMGPRNMVGEAFGRLAGIAGPAGLFSKPGAHAIAVFHAAPEGTPAGELRTDAGIVVSNGASIPSELTEVTVPGGDYATVTHHGHYASLGDSWEKLAREVAASGRAISSGDRPSYEIYRIADHSQPDLMETDLFLPLEGT